MLVNVPASQDEHATPSPPAPAMPTAHGTQRSRMKLEEVPGAHAVHVSEVLVEKRPVEEKRGRVKRYGVRLSRYN